MDRTYCKTRYSGHVLTRTGLRRAKDALSGDCTRRSGALMNGLTEPQEFGVPTWPWNSLNDQAVPRRLGWIFSSFDGLKYTYSPGRFSVSSPTRCPIWNRIIVNTDKGTSEWHPPQRQWEYCINHRTKIADYWLQASHKRPRAANSQVGMRLYYKHIYAWRNK